MSRVIAARDAEWVAYNQHQQELYNKAASERDKRFFDSLEFARDPKAYQERHAPQPVTRAELDALRQQQVQALERQQAQLREEWATEQLVQSFYGEFKPAAEKYKDLVSSYEGAHGKGSFERHVRNIWAEDDKGPSPREIVESMERWRLSELDRAQKAWLAKKDTTQEATQTIVTGAPAGGRVPEPKAKDTGTRGRDRLVRLKFRRGDMSAA